MKKLFNLIEQNLPWGLIGGVVGIIGVIIGTYYSLYYEKKTEISFQVINESDILDVRKPLKDLDIYFEDEDIQKDNLNLKVIRLKVINTGQVDILQNYYDKNGDWGFQISSGKIIEIRPTKNNSSYLEENIKPVQLGANFIKLEKIIFEKEKFISFEILILHNKNTPPRIIPVGKIAGIDKFKITDSSSKEEETSFWDDILYGKLPIHLIRFILYFLVFLLALALFVFILSKFDKYKENRGKSKRKKKLERLSLAPALDDPSFESIYKAYINGEYFLLEKLSRILKSENYLKNRIKRIEINKKYREELKNIEEYDEPIKAINLGIQRTGKANENEMDSFNRIFLEEEYFSSRHEDLMYRYYNLDKILNKLVETKKIRIDQDDKVIIDNELQNTLNVIIAILS